MLDEADSVFAKRRGERSEGAEDLRGILNAGHAPRLAVHPVEHEHQPARGVPDVRDGDHRRDRRPARHDRGPGRRHLDAPPRARRDGRAVPSTSRSVPPLHALRDRLHAWVRHHLDALADAEPELPVEDRAADVWEPLVAVADLAGGDWPDRARAACRALSPVGDDPDDASAGERLLADLADVFGDDERLPTETILERLHRIAEAPWDDWGKTASR